MKPYEKTDPTALVIFGAGGDLTWRKLVPAIYTLHQDDWLAKEFAVLGVDRKEMTETAFRKRMHDGVDKFSRYREASAAEWKDFSPALRYMQADFSTKKSFRELRDRLDEFDEEWQSKANRVFYLAVPPAIVRMIADGLDKAGLAGQEDRHRIVVEKPFGHDLDSARELNSHLLGLFSEDQIFRIDHYLGKETVQNIMAFRFANALYEPIWDRRYIDHVQITVAEDLGVEHRGAYYEGAGALRDMVQNHLSQVLCLVAMEPPTTYEANEIRNKKVEVLHAIRPIHRDHVAEVAARGQYDKGWIRGENVPAYRAEPDVDPESQTETFVAIKYLIDNWRWQDVPFYLRTGKRMPRRASEVVIQFRPVPHQSFPSSAVMQPQPNRLIIRIQPEEGIVQQFMAKHPGETVQLVPVEMQFFYREAFKTTPPEAYEMLLLDVMLGDPTQFMRADQLESSWEIITPVLEVWQNASPTDFPNYAAGSRGPESAEVLIARDGRSWILPEARRTEQAEGDAGEEEK